MSDRSPTNGIGGLPECEHDWRVDPNVILPSYPPQARHVCALCGAVKSSGINPQALAMVNFSRNPKDWPRV